MLNYSVDDDVALLHFDDGKANAVGFDFVAAMNDGLDRASSDARALVIAGMPGRFSAGFDLNVFRDGDADTAARLRHAGGEMLLRLFTHPQPVVVACTGHALAAGALILLTADTRLGAEGDFKIGLNEVAIGMALPHFAAEIARARLSKRHFARATTHAEIYTPDAAVDAGYLDEVAPPDRLAETAFAHAARLARLDPRAFAATKRALHAGFVSEIRVRLADDLARLLPG